MTKYSWITGFPRIGEHRELKKGLEQFWAGRITYHELEQTAQQLRKKHWLEQKQRNAAYISSNDFSYYDGILDTAVMLNAIPQRFRSLKEKHQRYFAMARGTAEAEAMEMTKWFNTNYHYLVPELDESTDFSLQPEKVLDEYREAKSLGIKSKIHLIGPITFTALSKTTDGRDPFHYFDRILALYGELLSKVEELDDSVLVQFDEPILVKDPQPSLISLVKQSYEQLSTVSKSVRILVSTYFEHASEAVKELADTPVWGIALDFIYGKKNLECLDFIGSKMLIAGVVDGRNIWRNNLDNSLKLLEEISQWVPREQIMVSTSCSLLHCPYSLRNERADSIRPWLSFATEKIDEVVLLAELFHVKNPSTKAKLQQEETRNILAAKESSGIIHNAAVMERMKNHTDLRREGTFLQRIEQQKKALQLPPLPTTTIGSFPQTVEIRKARRAYKKGELSQEKYEESIQEYIRACIRFQEETGLDVLVHGEPERNDMVEYFGELLEGFHFTQQGWVQSYGSRCVKPPVIFGDVYRDKPMTVDWFAYAQKQTEKMVKGMLTGPVTIINWSFVRDDIPPSDIAKQLGLALSDEIRDLQKAGAKIIQVDEAAFKEGYPLRKEKVEAYEKWGVESFHLAVSSASKETQIHTHMCYSQFDDIIETIEALDADVITIETAKSGNRLLNVFKERDYRKEIGPGVYDIHSPRVPSTEEFKEQIKERLRVVDASRMWVNPDCGLKTRKWEETKSALSNMVQATKELR